MCSRSWGLHGLPAVFKFLTSHCPFTAPHSQTALKAGVWATRASAAHCPTRLRTRDVQCRSKQETHHTVPRKGCALPTLPTQPTRAQGPPGQPPA